MGVLMKTYLKTESVYSEGDQFTVVRKPLVQTRVIPVRTEGLKDGVLFVDFGRAAFGTLEIAGSGLSGRSSVVVHLGEKRNDSGRIDREPPGTIRYIRIEQPVSGTESLVRIVIPPDERNTGKAAIPMPEDIGEVYPFRYAEIEDAAGLDPASICQVAVHYPFDETEAQFSSSNSTLDAVWELCRYSIKATSFCGVFVDGDRERIPYEGDALINQLGWYCTSSETVLPRFSHEYMIQYPTWPTEFQMQSVIMAWNDYMVTGNTDSLEMFYADLCAKTLIGLARPDGLISTQTGLLTREMEKRLNLYHSRYIFDNGLRDLVDWPPGSFTQGGQGERDNHEMLPVNTVVNAFHYWALVLMAAIAGVLGKGDDQQRFSAQAEKVKTTVNRLLLNPEKGIYIDGEGSGHSSLHSNMFALAFGLVPDECRQRVVDFIISRGMACSVYGAQHLLDGLYLAGEADAALKLMTATHDRSWHHMIEAGATMTWEAWDWKYKNNLDWNHAWGAAPANIIMRRLAGVRPAEAGFKEVLVQPQPGSLEHFTAQAPTPRGPVSVAYERVRDTVFKLKIFLPGDMPARVKLPDTGSGAEAEHLSINGKALESHPSEEQHIQLEPGSHEIAWKI